MSVLRIEHLHRAFGSLVVTNDVTLASSAGERHVIIGPNGAGKTSLINQIGGQLRPIGGHILLDGPATSPAGRPTASPARRRPHVPAQQSLPEPDASSRTSAARGAGASTAIRSISSRRRAASPTSIARAERSSQRPSRRRSRRASCATSPMASSVSSRSAWRLPAIPRLLLLDEPTSGMSPAETERMIALDRRAAARRSSILMIEHDMNVVFTRRRPHHRVLLRRGSGERQRRRDPRRPNACARSISGCRTACSSSRRQRLLRRQPCAARRFAHACGEGEVVCLLGRNGAGKTTTSSTTMGYVKPRPGRVAYRRRDIDARCRPTRSRASASASCRRSAAFFRA